MYKSLVIGVALTLVIAASFFTAYQLAGSQSPEDQAVLSIFCFQGYAEPEWISEFEASHNCKVRLTYTSTIEEMFEQTSAAPEAYHLVSLDSGRVGLYEKNGLLQAIDTGRLAHYLGIDPYFRSHPFSHGSDGDTILHVPIMWGTQTIVINRETVSQEILSPYLNETATSVSMDLLLDPALKGRIAFFDEAANVFAAAAMHVGSKDPHNLSDEEWQPVEDRIRAMAASADHFTTGIDSEFSALSSGEIWVLMGGNDALLARRLEDAGVGERFLQLPLTEGTHCWIDGWALTAQASGTSADLAHAWIDRMISTDGQKRLVAATGFGPVIDLDGGGDRVIAERVPWYTKPLAEFPGHLVIMAPEEDPDRRVETWKQIKSEAGQDP
jgi:putative spermidine/putrescine transport system substrate-binding protein/spermidine/putrescine transport system substrate-binding protein